MESLQSSRNSVIFLQSLVCFDANFFERNPFHPEESDKKQSFLRSCRFTIDDTPSSSILPNRSSPLIVRSCYNIQVIPDEVSDKKLCFLLLETAILSFGINVYPELSDKKQSFLHVICDCRFQKISFHLVSSKATFVKEKECLLIQPLIESSVELAGSKVLVVS